MRSRVSTLKQSARTLAIPLYRASRTIRQTEPQESATKDLRQRQLRRQAVPAVELASCLPCQSWAVLQLFPLPGDRRGGGWVGCHAEVERRPGFACTSSRSPDTCRRDMQNLEALLLLLGGIAWKR
jgi:hypothetical protein